MRRKVLVVIVSYKSADDVKKCLDALSASDYLDFEVAVCENGGEQAFAALADITPDNLSPNGQPVTVIAAPLNLGFAGGVNFLLNRAQGHSAYWILNPDTVPESDTLHKLVARLSRGDCSAVGHDIYWRNNVLASRGGRWQVFSARGLSLGMLEQSDAGLDEQELERKINYLIGASMLISRGFIERVGTMREDYFLYCEEVEWCLRALRLGERLGYASGAKVTHWHGTSTGGGTAHKGRSRLSVYMAERARILLTRDISPAFLVIVVPLAFINCIVRFGRRGAWRQLSYAFQGWRAGVLNERGPPSFLF